jgi:hypothetical protein
MGDPPSEGSCEERILTTLKRKKTPTGACGHSPEEAANTDRFVQGNTRMDPIARYQSKLTIAERAVTTIPSGSRLSMGMFAAEPQALLKALLRNGEHSRALTALAPSLSKDTAKTTNRKKDLTTPLSQG